jgi:hypothetical protein
MRDVAFVTASFTVFACAVSGFGCFFCRFF